MVAPLAVWFHPPQLCYPMDPVHPIINIISFLILTVALSLGGVAQLLLALLLVSAGYLLASQRNLPQLWTMLLRLRWLWLSLLVVYLWFTPGQALWQEWPAWSPTWEGLMQGLWRVWVLLLIAAAAHLLMQLYGPEEMVGAIHRLSLPLTWVGVSRDRFALRMMLVLEKISAVQPLQTLAREENSGARNPLVRISRAVAAMFQQALERAESEPAREVELPCADAPPAWQWLYPCGMVAGFWWVGSFWSFA